MRHQGSQLGVPIQGSSHISPALSRQNGSNASRIPDSHPALARGCFSCPPLYPIADLLQSTPSAASYDAASRSISSFVRFSVTATNRQSANSGYQWPNGTPAKIFSCSGILDQLTDRPALHADHKLLERRPIEPKRKRRHGRQPLGGITGLLQAQIGHVAHAGRTHQRKIDRRAQGVQTLVRADVARGLFAADVLLAGLKRQHPTARPRRSTVWPTSRPGMRRKNCSRQAIMPK